MSSGGGILRRQPRLLGGWLRRGPRLMFVPRYHIRLAVGRKQGDGEEGCQPQYAGSIIRLHIVKIWILLEP